MFTYPIWTTHCTDICEICQPSHLLVLLDHQVNKIVAVLPVNYHTLEYIYVHCIGRHPNFNFMGT